MKRDIVDRYYFKLINNASRIRQNVARYLDFEQKHILDDNKKYKDKYRGKRCFIIGNGPSLKQQDLSKMREDFVFTVNMFPQSPMYEQVNSDFHVMADAGLFHEEVDKEILDSNLRVFKRINTEGNNPICFFPYYHKMVIEKWGLSQFLDISYFHCASELYEGYKKKMDLTKCIPAVYNVVQFAIEIAIYMGFKEIYLLGCDMTIYEQVSFLYGKIAELHVYDMNEKEKEEFKHAHEKMEIEKFFGGFYNTLVDFRRLKEYCENQEIYLYNATLGGILESLPRVNYEQLF